MIPRITGKSSMLAVSRVWLIAAVLLSQSACHLGKQKTALPQLSSAPIRIAFLPLNTPADSADLRTVALTVPLLMAEIAANAPDLEAVPLWESMPVALEIAGPARTLTPEMAAEIANRLSAKWVTQGELASVRNSILVTEDFIPANARQIAFRYQRKCSIASLEEYLREGTRQFLRYIAVKPLTSSKGTPLTAKNFEEIAGALDREYGWFVPAEAGRAEKVVALLSRSDSRFARVLFNPALYPGIAPDQSSPLAQPNRLEAPSPSLGAATILPSATPPDAGRAVSSPPPGPSGATQSVDKEKLSGSPPPKSQPPATVANNPAPYQPQPFTQATSSLSSAPATAIPSPASPASQKQSPRPIASGASSVPSQRADQPPLKAAGSPGAVQPPPALRGKDFAIQVFSSQNRRTADAEARRLSRAGQGAQVEEAGPWHRVRLHGYKSFSAAKAAAEKLQSQGLIGQYWIVP